MAPSVTCKMRVRFPLLVTDRLRAGGCQVLKVSLGVVLFVLKGAESLNSSNPVYGAAGLRVVMLRGMAASRLA